MNSPSGTRRTPRTDAHSTAASSMSNGGSASPAGEAVPRFPPIVPRLRIWGEPTVRDASASAGRSPASSGSIASVYVRPAPRRSAPFSRDHPCSSRTSFRLSSAGGRPRSKLSSTIKSVPPWIGRESGCSAFSRNACSRVRGERTSTDELYGSRPMDSALSRRLAVARGDEPAELVVRGGRVLSVFTGEWLEADVAVVDGWIAGLGAYEGKETLDAAGRFVVPGFVDAHMHLESSKLLVDEFARLVLPFGTTTVVADPHEIANVLGTDGVHWLLDVCGRIPLDVWFMASSCVPASSFESPRRELTVGDLDGLLRRRRVIGLAEMMNFPGVVSGDERELEKLELARHVDGHAPGVRGRELNAYVAAGIRSDHEASDPEEGRERLRAGMWLLIREASAARNLHALLPLLAEYGPSRIAFCTDDREPEHIADDGHINSMVREAVAFGIPPEDALVCATLSPALWHGLAHLGAVAPGYHADLLILPDLERFVPETVLKRGQPAAEIPEADVPDWVRHTVRIGAFGPEMFRVPWSGGPARVIGIVPGQIITDALVDEPGLHGGEAVAD